jgi:hypothetical protein
VVVRGQRPDGRETWRSDLVVGQHHLTSDGLVVQAALDGGRRVVWTERRSIRDPEPQGLWTVDLRHPEAPPRLLLDDSDVVPFDPVVGHWFVAWSDNGQHLALMSVNGGPVTTVPGHVAVANAPSAYGRIVAVVLTHRGESRLEVLRVDP